ncbi:hypothetical protein EVJ58_g8368 [Rhodofomes roseus]|uniref:Peptidase A1 domain-containing protein n=1 Tax=Rhodofomes roseus TaxID=34475 RepID=A0A4Y9Y0J4_9APHY|nr:hypothetical protein EVJ58_g8368 [Rhodofomes roseus]
MYQRLLSFSFLASTVLSSAFAIHIPLRRGFVSSRDDSPHKVTVTKSSTSNDLSGFVNYGDFRYIGNITIAGQSYEVILDTGSPDLWVVTDSALPGAVNTSVSVKLNYGTDAADGSSIHGDIFTAEVEFAGFTIAQQAYIDVQNSTVSDGLVAPGISGLIGLSPLTETSPVASQLKEANYNASGYNTLQNIFFNDPSIQPQFTILMSRNDGLNETSGGAFTIGDPVPELASIQDTPILPVGSDSPLIAQHWTVHMDAIIINGQWYNTSSSGAANLSAILDTGTPTALVDPRFVDIMYGANAEQIDTDYSVVDCNAQVNVSLVFGENEFPINPIDAIQPVALAKNGSLICKGAIGRLAGSFPDGSLLLGDTFLRNAYTLYNLNIGNSSQAEIGPYVQMLSTTDAEAAAQEFAQANQERLSAFAAALSENSTSSSGSDDDDDLSVAGGVSSPSASSSSSDDYSALMRNSYIIIGLMAGALFLLIVIAAMLVRRARASPQRTYRPVGAEKSDQLPLQYEGFAATYKD